MYYIGKACWYTYLRDNRNSSRYTLEFNVPSNLKRCVDAKINTLEFEGKCSPSTESRPSVPVNLTCWLTRIQVNVKFEGVSAGVPIIPQIAVSASFADTECDKRIFKCKRIINECVGKISRCTRRQNRLWVADYARVTKSKLRMCNSDDVN